MAEKNSNMEIWEAVKKPPKEALKTIIGGRLKGMTDISPQWRYQALTEQFGVCGFGWRYSLNREWIVEGNGCEKVQYAEISLYVKMDGEWSEAIPGTGGSRFVTQEKAGPYTSDEALKMAITDALSCACKMLGFAADVYMGRFDGSKYKDEPPQQTKSKSNQQRQQQGKINAQQLSALKTAVDKSGVSRKIWIQYIEKIWSVKSATEFNQDQYNAALTIITNKPEVIKNYDFGGK